MNYRSNFHRVLVLVLLGAACFGAAVNAESAERQPNIIYINTDDWGIGKTPPYRMDEASVKIIKTPNLDRLRANGMLFTNAYAGNAVCSPSRCSLITGKHPGHAAWRANRPKPSVPDWPPKQPMLGEVARRAGYKTAGFGKLSPGGTAKPEEITLQGWDYWLGFLSHFDCRSYYPDHIWENGKKKPIPENEKNLLADKLPVLGEHGVFVEDLYADKAIEFIRKNRDEPFFIYYASTVPHGSGYNVPFSGLHTPSIEGYDKTNLTKLEQLYAALLTRHDRNVGRLIDTLHELGIHENTIVLWTSDNGDEDSYYRRTKTFDGNGPFREMKRSLYEGGIRVPLLAYWPGTIPPGSTSALHTSQIDIMPTLADAGGQPVSKEMDGISILPTLRNQPGKQTQREYLYWEFYERGAQQAVRMGKWKAYRAGGPPQPLELYDLSVDVGEENNIADQHPELVTRMKQIMRDEHETHPFWKMPGLDSE